MNEQEPQLLKDYSEQEKAAYLGAIASVASADRVASPEEVQFLTLLAQSAGLSAEGQQEVVAAAHDSSNISIRQCLDILKNSELRFSFITDVMSFAKADGKLDAQEQSKIQEMAQYLNINQQQFGALQQFVHKAEEAQQHGENPTDPNFLQRTGLANSLGQAGVPTGGMMQGLIGILAPIIISKVLAGRQGSTGNTGGGMGGDLLGGLLGSVMGGGAGNMGGLGNLGGILGGNQSAQPGRAGQQPASGGLGSLMGVLGGLGRQQGYNSGGLGSILGSVLGGHR
ncbi:TerB family tellurite resistance protein [Adhaeribacter rhizoryzae]|uniref:TerB family tellurite resistance protein n=1 Tax=Adhaeribacter rhizoryzae TaxID=2607907 RepID=A0A5M6D9F2_9BACT|nr:TerB family tellurite resistance protein [Adhaeribacter rhizoryzae]KAA5544161.1 TerB family tellurite resistance protein [Adhaeribacter rhizoryzae]